MKNFSDLTEQELLALAIALEEEDSRTYNDLAEASSSAARPAAACSNPAPRAGASWSTGGHQPQLDLALIAEQ
jgi:hypothetical protein